jgi:hypothetical protein
MRFLRSKKRGRFLKKAVQKLLFSSVFGTDPSRHNGPYGLKFALQLVFFAEYM